MEYQKDCWVGLVLDVTSPSMVDTQEVLTFVFLEAVWLVQLTKKSGYLASCRILPFPAWQILESTDYFFPGGPASDTVYKKSHWLAPFWILLVAAWQIVTGH